MYRKKCKYRKSDGSKLWWHNSLMETFRWWSQRWLGNQTFFWYNDSFDSNNFEFKSYNNCKQQINEKNKEQQKLSQTIINFFKNKNSKSDSHPSNEQIHETIVEFIKSDCQAYRVVEDDGFKSLIKLPYTLKYDLPSREFFKSFITNYMEMKKTIISKSCQFIFI